MSEAISHLLYTNKLVTQAATLTASSAASGYPATNLVDFNYATPWRSTAAGGTPQTITIDMGSAVQCNAVALGNLNIRSTATVTIDYNSSNSWPGAGPETISAAGMDGTRRNIYFALAAAQTYRYWRISITDNGNPDGFIQIGEIFLGMNVILSDGFDAGNVRTIQRSNVSLRTEYFQAYTYARDYGWVFDLTWTNIQQATRDQLRALNIAQKGDLYPFFFVLDPTVPAEAYFVRIGQPHSESRIFYNLYSVRMQLIEEMPGLIVPR